MGMPFKLKILGKLTGEGENMKKLWALFNGKKTLLAAILVSVPVIWAGVQPILEAGGMGPEQVAVIGGGILGAIGLLHKLMKVFGVAAPPEK